MTNIYVPIFLQTFLEVSKLLISEKKQSGQVTFIYIVLYTIQIESNKLYSVKQKRCVNIAN